MQVEGIADTAKQTREIRFVCRAAQLVLENGGETYRVEETALRIAEGFGLQDVNIVAFPTSIFVSVGRHTDIRRITRRGTNTTRLAIVNDISRRIVRGELDIAGAERELEAAAADPGWKQITLILGYGAAAASFSLLFGGTPGVLLVTFLIGLLVQAVQPLFSEISMGALFGNFAGGFLSAVLAQAAALLMPYGNVNAAIIGAIMPLLSGLLMTTAVRDTMYGDLISGIARAVDALLIAGSVALGVYSGLKLMAMLGGGML